ncbi:class I SAM-dependent methyltransferase [Candidatus Saccharibacteria bacterium]|nr:class I SAM-dependent methyltransferase [Candidatus Saccharibacteria bacterium]
MKKTTLPNDGERMVPELHKGTLLYAEHMTRYLMADPVIRNKAVLDIACGSGYGTHLMAKSAKKVYGVDLDKPTIDYANQYFSAPNIEYKLGDGINIPIDNSEIDVVITFETIEHIKNYKKFMTEIKRVLKPGGIAIISTPNTEEFTKGNEFHEHEFKQNELLDLSKEYFQYVKPYYQATWAYAQISDEAFIKKEGSANVLVHNLMPLKPNKYLYFYFVCSDEPIKQNLQPLGGLGGHYSARELDEIFKHYQKIIDDHKEVQAYIRKENKNLIKAHKELTARITFLEAQLNSITKSNIYKILRVASKLKKN